MLVGLLDWSLDWRLDWSLPNGSDQGKKCPTAVGCNDSTVERGKEKVLEWGCIT